jgi:hypothetical protein
MLQKVAHGWPLQIGACAQHRVNPVRGLDFAATYPARVNAAYIRAWGEASTTGM